MSGYDSIDPESRMAYDFSEKSIRQGFIRKVYGILMIQLAITTAFIALFLYVEPVAQWTYSNPAFFYVVLFASLGLMIALACCENLRRKSPLNFILLLGFTLAEGFLLGTAASTYKADAVLLAAGITVVVTMAVTLFAFQTKWDFTAMGGILLVCSVVLLIFGFAAIFLRGIFPMVQIIYASLGALLFCVYLIFDTQLLIGGSHKFSISPEEYVFASLSIYLDIINIFIFILSIIGDRE